MLSPGQLSDTMGRYGKGQSDHDDHGDHDALLHRQLQHHVRGQTYPYNLLPQRLVRKLGPGQLSDMMGRCGNDPADYGDGELLRRSQQRLRRQGWHHVRGWR